MPSGVPLIRVEPPTKRWWKSRTVWFNASCLALAAAESQLHVLESRLPGGLYTWLAFVLPIGNAVLRGITTTGVTFQGDTQTGVAPPQAPHQGGYSTVGLIAAIALLSALLWGVLSIGGRLERTSWLSRQNTEREAAKANYERLLREADAATKAAQAEARTARDLATQLQQELSHARVPLVSPRPVRAVRRGPLDGVGVHAAAAASAAADVAGCGAGDQPLAAAGDAPPGPDAAGGGELTLAAVRLWNSALAGEQLPAGACGADDPASEACALEAGLTLGDAWSNHIENAARCRIDRAHHQRLIDYLQRAQQQRQQPTETTGATR